MASFDYDVVVIGSGFAGGVAALRSAEKGYQVGVPLANRQPSWCHSSNGMLLKGQVRML